MHEEVHTSWEEAQRLGANGDLADELRPNLPPGVFKKFFFYLHKHLVPEQTIYRRIVWGTKPRPVAQQRTAQHCTKRAVVS